MLLVCAVALSGLAGCTRLKQTAILETTHPETGVVEKRTLDMTLNTTGSGKQAVEALRGSSGKTLSLGAKNADQESSLAGISDILGELLKVVSLMQGGGLSAQPLGITRSVTVTNFVRKTNFVTRYVTNTVTTPR